LEHGQQADLETVKEKNEKVKENENKEIGEGVSNIFLRM
jgi:hypothetical protein